MKYTSTLMHAVTDYAMAALLLVSPWLFGFSADRNATLCTMAFGVAMIAYSLFTDYELSVRRVIPMLTHLVMDGAVGGLLIGAPFMAGFAHTTWVPHLVLGCVEAGMAVLFALYLGFLRLGGWSHNTPGRRHAAH